MIFTATSEDVQAYHALNQWAYGWFAPWYDALVRPFASLRRTVVAAASLPPGARLLDAATGTGAQARAFAETGREVVGIDLSPAMLRIARRKHRLPNLAFQRADAAVLPFAEASFDAVCISFALHEMPPAVREQCLAELARVVKPGGKLVAVDYGLPRGLVGRTIAFHLIKLYERDFYVQFISSDLRALLAKAGFATVEELPALRGNARIWIAERSRP